MSLYERLGGGEAVQVRRQGADSRAVVLLPPVCCWGLQPQNAAATSVLLPAAAPPPSGWPWLHMHGLHRPNMAVCARVQAAVRAFYRRIREDHLLQEFFVGGLLAH